MVKFWHTVHTLQLEKVNLYVEINTIFYNKLNLSNIFSNFDNLFSQIIVISSYDILG